MQFSHPIFQEKYYLSGAVVIGGMQVIDAIAAINEFKSSIALAFSLLELCWFLVSLIFLLIFYWKKQSLKLLIVPLMYNSFYIASYFYASYLLAIDDSGSGLQLPVWYLYAAGIFGVIYCISAIRAYQCMNLNS